MCGIIGSFTTSKDLRMQLSLKSIAHRGPDSQGEWSNPDGNIWFGHTRLSIIDLSSAGHQPMIDSSGNFCIVFNGEIYNHLTLRSLLPNVAWRGHSDTETLVELFAEMGVSMLPLLKGMFAFTIVNINTGELFLVRDRFGIKPLYYSQNEVGLAFCSELRPLLKLSPSNIFSSEALAEYLSFGRLPGSGQLLGSTFSMSTASYIHVNQKGELTETIWWSGITDSIATVETRSEAVKLVKVAVETAVHEHMIADVDVGVFLSGGIDSAIITRLSAQHLNKRPETFTIGFDINSLDERTKALRIATLAETKHHFLEVNADQCFLWIMEAIQKMDSPSVDALNTYVVSKAVKSMGIKVALSGLGGDELFGGYPSFNQVPQLSYLRFLPVSIRNQFIKLLPSNIQDKLIDLRSFSKVDLTVARRRFNPVKNLTAFGLSDNKPLLPASPESYDTMATISWAEIYGYMTPMLLRDSDQMSMSVGLEIRIPFLDHTLVETALQIPQQFKKGKGSKPLLCEAFSAILPKEIVEAPKKGFSLPMDQWIRGPLETFTYDNLKLASAQLDSDLPLKQWKEFKEGRLHWTRVWQLAVLANWSKTHEVALK